jgi:hypothetical protein
MKIPDFITEALQRPIDYSQNFTQRVSGLAKALSETLGLPVSHDADMNYRAGQNLCFSLQVAAPGAPRRKGTLEIRIYLTSRGPLFAFYCFDPRKLFVAENAAPYPVPFDRLPGAAHQAIERCRQVLAANGWREVEQEWLGAMAPGCLTELDDLPASVFEALFTEIIP